MKGFCNTHGGYNNESNSCLFCDYNLLELTKAKRCACKVEIKWGKLQNYIEKIIGKPCRRHHG